MHRHRAKGNCGAPSCSPEWQRWWREEGRAKFEAWDPSAKGPKADAPKESPEPTET